MLIPIVSGLLSGVE